MTKDYAMFNGKKYTRLSYNKCGMRDVKRQAKKMRKEGFNAIVDKNKSGYFIWAKGEN